MGACNLKTYKPSDAVAFEIIMWFERTSGFTFLPVSPGLEAYCISAAGAACRPGIYRPVRAFRDRKFREFTLQDFSPVFAAA